MVSIRQTSLVALLVAFILVGFSASAAAETKAWADGAESSPEMSDLIPNPQSGEAYSERYSIKAPLDGGGKIVMNFTVSNLGWGDQNGHVKVKVKFPDREDYKFSKKQGKNNWSYSKEKFEIEMAKTSIEEVGENAFRLKHEGDVAFDLKMTSDVPMWSPGRGRLDVDGGFMELDFFGLRGTVDGKIRVDGEWREVKGTRTGYGEHSATNIAPYDLATRFSRTRIYDNDDDVFFMWREIKLVDEYGGDSINWVVVGYKDQIVFSDPDATVKFGKVKKDKAGYNIPYAVQVEGEEGEDAIKLVMRADDMKRKDLLDKYGGVVRMVASSVSEPYHYRFDSKYALEMKIQGASATVRGKGGYVVDYLNKP